LRGAAGLVLLCSCPRCGSKRMAIAPTYKCKMDNSDMTTCSKLLQAVCFRAGTRKIKGNELAVACCYKQASSSSVWCLNDNQRGGIVSIPWPDTLC
jgi:hypothetical protein